MLKRCKISCLFFTRYDQLLRKNLEILIFFKSINFLKELNRVRKAALTFGFHDLFDGLAEILQRELFMLTTSNTANPETILEFTHCINCLRAPEYKDFRKDIQPFVSNAPQFNRKFNK